MGMYESFARVYDEYMDNTPYDDWCEKIVRILKEHGIEEGLILDLGCGTGEMTERLAKAGYDMIGIDYSADMLDIALDKKYESGHDILYLEQDMREFELYGTVRAIVCVCDSLNYIMSEEDLVQVFRLVNNYLDPDGICIFDMKTVHTYADVMGDKTIVENRENGTCIWENTWYEDEMVNEYDLTLYIGEENGLFRRYQEVHAQKAYTPETVAAAVEEAGMIIESAQDAATGEEIGEETERFMFVVRECGKSGMYTG